MDRRLITADDPLAPRTRAVRREQVGERFVPSPAEHLSPVPVGDELVLLDGWHAAQVLNTSAAAIWSRFDGVASLAEIAARLSRELGSPAAAVLGDVVSFTRQVSRLGLLDGVDPASDHADVRAEPVPEVKPGDLVEDFTARDLEGAHRSLSDLLDREVMLVNWNPHCGYCAGIADALGDLAQPLDAAGVRLVLVASGDPVANRRVAESAGLTSTFLLPDGDSPFGTTGTPSAYHLDPSGRIKSPPAYGNGNVVSLAESLAGIEPQCERRSAAPRYLFDRYGVCAPGTGAADGVTWTGTRVYRLGGYHVGIRVDSDATAEVLDRLFAGARIDDPRAGYSFSVALPSAAGASMTGTAEPDRGSRRGLNLLVQPTRTPLRSRDPARVLRALLSDISDGTGRAPAGGRRRLNAIAVRTADRGVGLVPINFNAFAPRLQPLLARRGLALADVRCPEIDLGTAEVVVPRPSVVHDATVVDDVGLSGTLGTAELPSVRPGRYPLIGWCVILPGDRETVELSPAQAAAATVSFVLDSGDAPTTVRELGGLFTRIPAYGLWYDSDSQMADLVAGAFSGR